MKNEKENDTEKKHENDANQKTDKNTGKSTNTKKYKEKIKRGNSPKERLEKTGEEKPTENNLQNYTEKTAETDIGKPSKTVPEASKKKPAETIPETDIGKPSKTIPEASGKKSAGIKPETDKFKSAEIMLKMGEEKPAKNDGFVLVGILPDETERLERKSKKAVESAEYKTDFSSISYTFRKQYAQKLPWISVILLTLLLLGCLFCDFIMTKDPTYMDLKNTSTAPNGEFFFGTDTLGRDIFSMIWYGGRISLFIGFFSTAVSTVIAVVYGTVSGLAPQWLDTLMMRLTELILSIPSLLLILLLQAILGEATVLSISIVIGLTSWTGIAKVVRTEVLQLRNSEYVIAARTMGAGFFHILCRHLMPNFISSILFMVVMNIRNAIVAESTLSFIGMGLPVEIISWGSMLSLSEQALLTASWWMILIPGVFLVGTLLCVTSVGNSLRKGMNKRHGNL